MTEHSGFFRRFWLQQSERYVFSPNEEQLEGHLMLQVILLFIHATISYSQGP